MPDYNPREVMVVYGVARVTGFEPGTFITVEQNNDLWTMKEGVDGGWVRSRHGARGATVTMTLMHASPSNDMLAAQMALDLLTGKGMVPFLLKDNNSNILVSAPWVWVKRIPTIELAEESGSYEWVLEGPNFATVPGGLLGSEFLSIPR